MSVTTLAKPELSSEFVEKLSHALGNGKATLVLRHRRKLWLAGPARLIFRLPFVMTGAEKVIVEVVRIVNEAADTEPAPPLEPSRKVSVQLPLP